MTVPTIKIPDGLGLAWIPYAKGQRDLLALRPDGVDIEAVALWDDGSTRVEHLWAEWVNGSPLVQESGGVFPDVGFVGGMPVVTEIRGKATCSHKGTVIRDTPFRRVTFFEGPLKNPSGLPDFAYRRTWVTSFRGHKTILVDHSITWIRPMKDYRVTEVKFGPKVQWSHGENNGIAWHNRPWWNGEQPLGEPLGVEWMRAMTPSSMDSEFNENRREHYIFADLHGTTIRDRFTFDVDTEEMGEWPAPGRCDDAWIEASGIFPVSCGKKDAVDQYIVGMAESFHSRASLGRFTAGNPPRKWNVKENRPSAHRPGIGAYYEWGNTLWHEYARLGDPGLLRCASLMTDHTVQFGQLSHGSYSATPSEDFSKQLDKWHRNAGAFWKLGEPVGNPPGMLERDLHCAFLGRSPDPLSLYFAHIFDGDQRARWGFDLWWNNGGKEGMRTWRGANREGNKTIGVLADVMDWLPETRADMAPHLNAMVEFHMRKPLYEVDPGPLWDPLWCNKALPFLSEPNKTAILNYVSACRSRMRDEGITRLKDTEAMGLSMLMPASSGYMQEHLPWVAHQVHRAGGVGPGPLGDQFLARQWGSFRKALESSIAIPERTWPITIPIAQVSFGDVSGVSKRGTRIGLHTESHDLAFPLHIAPVAGDPHPITWVVLDSAGVRVASGEWRWQKSGPMIPRTLGYRKDEVAAVPGPGHYTLCVGGHEGELQWWEHFKSVTLPAGTYNARCPNRYRLQGPGQVTIHSESTESWVRAELNESPLLSAFLEIGKSPVTWPVTDSGLSVDLVSGSMPRARLVLSQPMTLEMT